MNKDELTALFRRTFKTGILRRVPKKTKDAAAVLALSIVSLDADGFYDENEIDLHLTSWLEGIGSEHGNADHVTWRRALVDYGFLRRATDGVIYRVDAQRIDESITAEARAVNPKRIFAEVELARIERQNKYRE
jgi:hypothetical protein